MKYDYLIVGAGFAGSVMAERIASELNKKVLLIDKRNHIAGSAFDELDDNGILVNRYGPHIFHTNSRMVLNYLSKFTRWRKYEHVVNASYKNQLYPMPINRLTINKLYKINLSSEDETISFLERVREKRFPIHNSEDLMVNKVGLDLFKIFFEQYSLKQWQRHPRELSPSVCARIPVRMNSDCRYFDDKYQFIPLDGYNKLFRNMLNNHNIELALNTDYKKIICDVKFDKVIYSGPIDYFFDYQFGKLPYISLKIEYENHKCEFYQKYAQINYVDESTKYTRIVEYKYLSGQKANTTTITKEYSQISGDPFYPILTKENIELSRKYKNETAKLKNVIFCGRLAEYSYSNMDKVIANTLKKFNVVVCGK